MQPIFLFAEPPLVTLIVLSFVIPCLNEAATIGSVSQCCHVGGRVSAATYKVVMAEND
jgi:hypothetical protein